MANNTLWNSGVDEQGNPLAAGSDDPHWFLVQVGMTPQTPAPAQVLADQKNGTYFVTSDSRWVWADAAGKALSDTPYVFETRFLIESDHLLEWVELRGTWGADNFGQITVDGHPLPPGSVSGQTSLPNGLVVANYDQPHDFSIFQAHSPFVTLSQLPLMGGWRRLQVTVTNEGARGPGNPAGFNLSALQLIKHALRRVPDRVPHVP